MKWWGWGEEDVTFEHADKPALRPFIQQHLGVDVAKASAAPVAFGDLDVPEPVVGRELRRALEAAVGAEHVADEPLDRVVHARGKALRDLVRQRSGELGRAPGPRGASRQRGGARRPSWARRSRPTRS